VLADLACIVAAYARLQLVVGEPLVEDLSLEGLLPARWITLPACSDTGLGIFPGVIGVLPVREGARRAFPPADVKVIRHVAGLAVLADTLARESYDPALIV
jgi:hypothetical protein